MYGHKANPSRLSFERKPIAQRKESLEIQSVSFPAEHSCTGFEIQITDAEFFADIKYVQIDIPILISILVHNRYANLTCQLPMASYVPLEAWGQADQESILGLEIHILELEVQTREDIQARWGDLSFDFGMSRPKKQDKKRDRN